MYPYMVYDVVDPVQRIEQVRKNRSKKLQERSINKSKIITHILENDEVLKIKKIHKKEQDRLNKFKNFDSDRINLDDDIVNIEDASTQPTTTMPSNNEPRYNSSIDLSLNHSQAKNITVISQNELPSVINKPRSKLKNHYFETMKK